MGTSVIERNLWLSMVIAATRCSPCCNDPPPRTEHDGHDDVGNHRRRACCVSLPSREISTLAEIRQRSSNARQLEVPLLLKSGSQHR